MSLGGGIGQTLSEFHLVFRTRGIALLYTLAVGALLIVLSVSLMVLYSNEVHAQAQHQQAIQAYWNARGGLEQYAYARLLPDSGHYDFGSRGQCRVYRQASDVVFEGSCGTQKRAILLKRGDPGCRQEFVP